MATLTIQQTYAVARQAGFTPAQAVTMTAIAIAESGLRTDNVGDVNLTTPGEKSVGLWQINYRPGRDAGDPTRDPNRNLDPLTNARAAYQISGGGKSFRPWSTYTNGAYASNLGAVTRALGGQDPTQAVGLPTGTAAASTSTATASTSSSGHDWKIPIPGLPDIHLDGAAIMRGALAVGTVTAGITLVVLGLVRTVAPAAQRTLNSGAKAAEMAALA